MIFRVNPPVQLTGQGIAVNCIALQCLVNDKDSYKFFYYYWTLPSCSSRAVLFLKCLSRRAC